MIENLKKTIPMLGILVWLCAATTASAQPTAAPVAPKKALAEARDAKPATTLITVSIENGTIGSALLSIAKQTGWGLVIRAPESMVDKPVTLLLQKRPAGEVLDLVLAGSGLKTELKEGLLLVTPETPETPPAGTPPAEAPMPETAAPEPTATATQAADHSDPASNFHHRWAKAFFDRRSLKDRVEVGDSVTVGAGERVSSAVSIGGSTTVKGRVDKDAVAVGGTVTVKPGAVVDGSAVAIGGKVIIEQGGVVEEDAISVGDKVEVAKGAVMGGDQVSVGIPIPPLSGIAGAVGGWIIMNTISGLMRSLFLFGVALLLIWLIPKRVEAVTDYLLQKPGVSIVSGLVLFIAMVPLIILLAITLIGIPLIPVAVIGFIALMFLGFTAFFLFLGHRIPILKERKSQVMAVAIGCLAFTLINIVPIIGGIFLLLAGFAAVGAALQSRFGTRPKKTQREVVVTPVEMP